MTDGGRPDGGINGDADPQLALLQRIEEAGWASGGGFGPNEVNLGFFRQEDRLDVGFVEATERLGILGDDGQVRPGFSVAPDSKTGVTVISYSGPPGEQFDGFVDRLVALGEELEVKQEEALAR
ncbi:MAG TPA: hypothetical protein VN554_00860, partial [Verrucomicrobiae bacterium]|nr:hypothetical protein [Verrucomicrobiae bacterium]